MDTAWTISQRSPFGGAGALGASLKLYPSHEVDYTEASAVSANVIRIDHGLTCRAAYVGVNTWDLMDKSRDIGARPEVQARLDAMKQGGWAVGRTWGFSLGTGLVNSPVGQVVADPTKILETAPGATRLLQYVPVYWWVHCNSH